MRLMSYGLALGIAAFATQPAHAIQVRTALLFSPGVELSKPFFKWPMNASATALKEAIDAYKGSYKDEISAYYGLNDYRRIWVSDGHFLQRGKDLIKRFEDAQYDGLQPKDYLKTVFFNLDAPDANEKAQAEAEIELSASAVNFARHLSSGRIDPARVGVFAKPDIIPVRQILSDMANMSDVKAQFAKYEPTHAGYRVLHDALAKALGEKKLAPEKPYIPSGPILSEGMKDERVPMLRARFALNAYSDASPIMDSELTKAVRDFQEDNGLKATGILSKSTVRILNEQAEAKARGHVNVSDLIVNMERWRWLPRDLGAFNVTVNIPEFLVRVSKGGETTYEGRVVVGKASTPTPIFSDEIEYLVVNPSWNVPPSIVRNEMLPMLEEDPEAFMRRGFEVRQDSRGKLSFRQPPSAMNALGRVKFMFPNDHDVYLHDTPAKGYFDRDMRAFSHGCVRVDRPLKFADALLVHESKLNSKMLSRMFGGEERFLNLEKHVPVHLVYFTAFAGEGGAIERRADIYGLDSRMKALMGLGRKG
jgi:murein L,D-transpeptidase YcbB/YkuD